MNSRDLSKLAEHVRFSHFNLLVACFLVILSNHLVPESKWHEARRELHLINGLLDEWDSELLQRLAVEKYETEIRAQIPKHIYGALRLGPDKNRLFFEPNEIFTPAPFPVEEEFYADATTILSNELLKQWKSLQLISEKYPPPRYPPSKLIDGSSVYQYSPPGRHHLPAPTNLPELEDFWNILDLDYTLSIATPKTAPSVAYQLKPDFNGIFSITKYSAWCFGSVTASFQDGNNGYSDGEGLWHFAGALQPGTDELDTGIISPEFDEFYGTSEYNSDLGELRNLAEKTQSEAFLFLSLNQNFVAMASYGAGWIENLDESSAAKDFTVTAIVVIPVASTARTFHAQGLLTSRLPLGFPNTNILHFGRFEKTFPHLNAIKGTVGSSGFQEIEIYLRERADIDSKTATLSIVGVSLPVRVVTLFGNILILLFQAYFHLHFSRLARHAADPRDDGKLWNIPWIGLYVDSAVARLVLITTSIVVPFFTVLLSLILGQFSWYVVPPILLLLYFWLATLITYIKFWTQTKPLIKLV